LVLSSSLDEKEIKGENGEHHTGVFECVYTKCSGVNKIIFGGPSHQMLDGCQSRPSTAINALQYW
jgi:hypothetical protein